MYYMLNMRGFKPVYYNANEYGEALKKYYYLKTYFSGVSLVRVSWKRMYKDVFATQRTI